MEEPWTNHEGTMEEVPLNPVLMGGFLCRNNTCSKSGKSNEITWFGKTENRSGLNKESFKFKKTSLERFLFGSFSQY
ncbi:MAG: hypothetical protein ACPGSG_04110 [Prolixibacteraceae bacterium]